MIKVFPNPAREYVTISVSNNSLLIENVQLYDGFGRNIKIDGLLNGTELTIERGNLPSGIYFIKVVSDKGQHTARLIFQ